MSADTGSEVAGITTLQIRPFNGKWCVYRSFRAGEFEPASCLPNSLGFIHYDSQINSNTAFDLLRTAMIAAHRAEIENLQKSLNALTKLTLPEKI